MFYLLYYAAASFFNPASAFTSFYSSRLDVRGGRLASIFLRDVIGIPVWAIGYGMPAIATSTRLFNPNSISSTLACLLIVPGVVSILLSLISLWRRAAAPSVQDAKVW